MTSKQFVCSFVLILGAGLGSRLVLVAIFPMDSIPGMKRPVSDEQAYLRLARNLVERGEYVGNYKRAYLPPGYPAFLALHFTVFGENYRVVQLTQNLLFLAAVSLFGVMASKVLGRPGGLVSMVMLLVHPQWMVWPQQALSDTLFTFLLVLGFFLAQRAWASGNLTTAVFAGTIIGASALVREIGLYLGVLTALTTFVSLRRTEGARRGLLCGGLMLAGVGLPIAPWTARNYYTFETFVPITTNSAINLYMGNNPEATGGFHWKLPDRAQELWNLPDDDSSHEREIYLLSKQEAVDYMLSHPGRTIALWPQKLWSLWEPGPAAGSSSAENLYRFYRTGVHWGPYLILSCWGIWLLRRDRLVQLVCGVALCGSLVHLLTYGAIRYRAPYEFLFALPATGALLYLISKVRLQFSNRSIGKISFRFQTRERAEVTFSRTETSAG